MTSEPPDDDGPSIDADESDGDPDALAPVIDFVPRGTTFPPLQRARWMKQTCAHAQVELDEKSRVCVCLKCGKPVDPFEVLLSIERRWATITSETRAAEREVQRLEEQVEQRKKNRAAVSRAREARAFVRQVKRNRIDDTPPEALGRWVLDRLRDHPFVLLEVVADG